MTETTPDAATQAAMTWVRALESLRSAGLHDEADRLEALSTAAPLDPMAAALTTAHAAEALGISEQRVRILIAQERLPARKVGRDWLIRREDLAAVAHRPNGRPRRAGND